MTAYQGELTVEQWQDLLIYGEAFTAAGRRVAPNPVHLPAVYDGPPVCPKCGGTTVTDTVVMDALIRHGGYGESVRITARTCVSCWHSDIVARESVRPRR